MVSDVVVTACFRIGESRSLWIMPNEVETLTRKKQLPRSSWGRQRRELSAGSVDMPD
jgi:hypothetical protein